MRFRARSDIPAGPVLCCCLALFVFSGCASTTMLTPGSAYGEASTSLDRPIGPEPYKVGPVNVWLKPQPEVEFLCRMRLTAVRRDQRVMGCYLADSRTIISVADPYVLLHEFRHHFEGKFHE